MRHVPNLRYTARGRPHSLQRDSRRVENFGVRFAFAIFDLLATDYSLKKLDASKRSNSRTKQPLRQDS